MIRKMILRNFRGHTRSFEFGPQLNVVRGRNEAGKSTIKEAIAFAWFGSDSTGKSADHLISIGEPWAEVIIETEFITLTRRKLRGKTPTIKLMQHGYPSIDLNQTELNAKLKLSIEAFMSCWNVGYFTTLTTAKQLAVLGELAKTDRRQMLTELLGQSPPEALKLDNLKVAADSVATKRRQIQNIKASEEGALGQLEAQIDAIKAAESVDPESYQGRLNEVNAAIADFDLYSKELSRYRAQFTSYQLASKNRDEATNGLQEVEEQLKKLPPLFGEQKMKDAVRASEELKKDADRLRTTSVQSLPICPKKPSLAVEGDCLACGQRITDTYIKKAMATYEADLIEYNRLARLTQSSNDEVLSQAKTKEDQAREFYQQSVDMHRSDDRVRQETNRLSALRSKYEAALSAKVDEPKAPRRPEGDEEALKKEQLHINTELNMARRKATELKTLLDRHEQMSQALATKAVEVEKYGRLEKAILALPELETKKTLDTIAIPGVGISLVDGELQIADDKGVSYQSLSSGRKMKVNSLICGRLRSCAGLSAPKWLFVDDTDLMDSFKDFVPEDLQVFVVKVEPKLKDVVVDIV